MCVGGGGGVGQLMHATKNLRVDQRSRVRVKNVALDPPTPFFLHICNDTLSAHCLVGVNWLWTWVCHSLPVSATVVADDHAWVVVFECRVC